MPLMVSMDVMVFIQSKGASSLLGRPSKAIRPPLAIVSSMLESAEGAPDISRPISHPSFMPSSVMTSPNSRCGRVHGERDAGAASQLEPVGADVGDHHMAGAGMPGHCCGHDADRAGTGHQNILTQYRECQRRVDGVAEGVKDRRYINVERCRMTPHVPSRDRDVLGEPTVAVYTDSLGVWDRAVDDRRDSCGSARTRCVPRR